MAYFVGVQKGADSELCCIFGYDIRELRPAVWTALVLKHPVLQTGDMEKVVADGLHDHIVLVVVLQADRALVLA